jgi:hypothetical protein
VDFRRIDGMSRGSDAWSVADAAPPIDVVPRARMAIARVLCTIGRAPGVIHDDRLSPVQPDRERIMTSSDSCR